MTLRVFSYGGGVQSTAALVLAAERKIDFPRFVFANVGEFAEHPKTLDYVTEVAGPYAERHGLKFYEVQKRRRDKSLDDLHSLLCRSERSIGIPIRMNDSGAPGNRQCTQDFKIKPIAAQMKRWGATEHVQAVIGLGISMDEHTRMRSESGIPHYTLEYPLIDGRLNRQDCVNIIAGAGLPLPVKSSCWFCPYHTPAYWTRQRRLEPDLFAKSVDLERMINDRRQALGKDPVWLSRKLIPLDQAIGDQMTMDELMDEDNCATGYCGL